MFERIGHSRVDNLDCHRNNNFLVTVAKKASCRIGIVRRRNWKPKGIRRFPTNEMEMFRGNKRSGEMEKISGVHDVCRQQLASSQESQSSAYERVVAKGPPVFRENFMLKPDSQLVTCKLAKFPLVTGRVSMREKKFLFDWASRDKVTPTPNVRDWLADTQDDGKESHICGRAMLSYLWSSDFGLGEEKSVKPGFCVDVTAQINWHWSKGRNELPIFPITSITAVLVSVFPFTIVLLVLAMPDTPPLLCSQHNDLSPRKKIGDYPSMADRPLAQLPPSALIPNNQCAVRISVFVRKTVESSLQFIEHAHFSGLYLWLGTPKFREKFPRLLYINTLQEYQLSSSAYWRRLFVEDSFLLVSPIRINAEHLDQANDKSGSEFWCFRVPVAQKSLHEKQVALQIIYVLRSGGFIPCVLVDEENEFGLWRQPLHKWPVLDRVEELTNRPKSLGFPVLMMGRRWALMTGRGQAAILVTDGVDGISLVMGRSDNRSQLSALSVTINYRQGRSELPIFSSTSISAVLVSVFTCNAVLLILATPDTPPVLCDVCYWPAVGTMESRLTVYQLTCRERYTYENSQGPVIEPYYRFSVYKIMGTKLKVSHVHAARREHCVPASSPTRSGDYALDARDSVALIALELPGHNRGKQIPLGRPLKRTKNAWRWVCPAVVNRLLESASGNMNKNSEANNTSSAVEWPISFEEMEQIRDVDYSAAANETTNCAHLFIKQRSLSLVPNKSEPDFLLNLRIVHIVARKDKVFRREAANESSSLQGARTQEKNYHELTSHTLGILRVSPLFINKPGRPTEEKVLKAEPSSPLPLPTLADDDVGYLSATFEGPKFSRLSNKIERMALRNIVNKCGALNHCWKLGNFADSFGDKQDSIVLCELELESVVHWLMIQFYSRPETFMFKLDFDDLRASLEICFGYFLRLSVRRHFLLDWTNQNKGMPLTKRFENAETFDKSSEPFLVMEVTPLGTSRFTIHGSALFPSQLRGVWSSAVMQGRGERGIREKTRRPAASSGKIPAGNRTRFAFVGGESSGHCNTAAPPVRMRIFCVLGVCDLQAGTQDAVTAIAKQLTDDNAGIDIYQIANLQHNKIRKFVNSDAAASVWYIRVGNTGNTGAVVTRQVEGDDQLRRRSIIRAGDCPLRSRRCTVRLRTCRLTDQRTWGKDGGVGGGGRSKTSKEIFSHRGPSRLPPRSLPDACENRASRCAMAAIVAMDTPRKKKGLVRGIENQAKRSGSGENYATAAEEKNNLFYWIRVGESVPLHNPHQPLQRAPYVTSHLTANQSLELLLINFQRLHAAVLLRVTALESAVATDHKYEQLSDERSFAAPECVCKAVCCNANHVAISEPEAVQSLLRLVP
ncbi:hypothetical protein PR048_031260 [Dryococelus australis]|uniref:Uncharacterized protein n=1 Tax=Dryococelus australis TaxID=614101 RepID=A0ABQ9G4R1_9NEOP|nr:hypothetical protein PR048_031260 [Dryococelus australis]